MIKVNHKNAFLTQVEDKFALIDRENGKIYILDEANANLYSSGKRFSAISSETAIIQAGGSNTEPGTGTSSYSYLPTDEENQTNY